MAHLVKQAMLWILGLGLTLSLIRGAYWMTSSNWIGPALTAEPYATEWENHSAQFGGLSGLLIENGGANIIAASDRGTLFNATLTRDTQGNITQITDVTEHAIRLPKGGPVDRFKGDIEGLSRLQDGRLALSFEGYARIMTMDTLAADTVWTHRWDRFESYFNNSAFEGLATLPDGRLMVLVETRGRYGMGRAYVKNNGREWTGPHPVPVTPRFKVTGADVGPDGCLYTLERRFNLFVGIEYRVMRHWQAGGVWTKDAGWNSETLYVSAKGRDGNGEGLSVWQDKNGLRITVITDDGFLSLPRTQLVELQISEGVCR
jgi:hypothetical protein